MRMMKTETISNAFFQLIALLPYHPKFQGGGAVFGLVPLCDNQEAGFISRKKALDLRV